MVDKVTFKIDNLRGGGFLLESQPSENFECNCDIINVGRLLEDTGKVIDCFNICGEYTGDSILKNIGKFLRSQGASTVCSSITFEGDTLKCNFINIHNNIVMGDLVGCVKNLRLENDVLRYDIFSTSSNLNKPNFSTTDANNLNGIVKEVNFTNDILKCQMINGVNIQ